MDKFPFDQLRKLTGKKHLLALWFAARESRASMDFIAKCANLVCEQQLAKEVSDDLNQEFSSLFRELINSVSLNDPTLAGQIKACF